VISTAVGVGDFDLTTVAGQGRSVVVIRGDLDLHTALALREKLLGLIRAGHHNLVLNLDGVQCFDSPRPTRRTPDRPTLIRS
jgi:anti-anti-sigma factor